MNIAMYEFLGDLLNGFGIIQCQSSVRVFFVADEKDFTLENAKNRQNDIVDGAKKSDISSKRRFHETNKFSKKDFQLECLGKGKQTVCSSTQSEFRKLHQTSP